MKEKPREPRDAVEALMEKLDRDAESSGYHLNPDREQVRILAEGLVANMERYGYGSCPCRLADGERETDLDIICPCDYRDPDLADWGACYCALYVSSAVARGDAEAVPVPERRPAAEALKKVERERTVGGEPEADAELEYPVWRCSVCGYLCARDQPPDVCPVCKASKDRFRIFM